MALAAVLAMGAGRQSRAATNAVWTLPGGGSWNTAANWSPVGVPDNGGANTYTASVLPTTPNSIITLTGDIDIETLTLGANGIISIDTTPGGSSLGINDNGSVIDGTILLNDGAATVGTAFLFAVGDHDLSGTGRIVFNTPFTNQLGPIALSGSPTWTLGAGLTVTTSPGAAGDIVAIIVNNAVIDADNGTITLASNVQGMTNNNIVRATNGGTLYMSNVGQFDNAGGQIIIDPTSTMQWELSAIQGGLIAGGGQIDVIGANNPTLDGTVSPLELNNVTVNIEPSTAANGTHKLILRGDIVNNATIRLNDTNAAATANAILEANGAATLGGVGSVFFDTSGTNLIRDSAAGGSHSLTVGSGQSIATSNATATGEIAATLINNGLVSADGGTITLSVRTKTNNGVMQAVNGGLLELGAIPSVGIDNTGGVITVDAASSFSWLSSRIVGGQFNGAGVFSIDGLLPTLDATSGAINNSTINIEPPTTTQRRLTVIGDVTNNGVIRLADATTNRFAYLTLSGSVQFNGTGQIVFDTNSVRNRIEGVNTLAEVTFGAGHTLSIPAGAAGTILVPVTNFGVIDVDGALSTATTTTSITNGSTGVIQGAGLIDMIGTTRPVVNGGEVEPGGAGAGLLTIGGSYQQTADGELRIDIGGLIAGSGYDQLAIIDANTTADLDGELIVELINSFVPDISDEFFVLTTETATGVSGEFVNAPRANPILTTAQGTFFVDYRANAVVLTNFEPADVLGVPE
ncbi:MAG: hypothetical protein KDA41_08445, partial [Planctomycetales bacterium]|nr:hypothetical protein [Planctomycetales bacterium]